MLRVRIGDAERRWERVNGIEEHWIAQQLTERRADNASPCVVVEIETPDVDVVLATARCAGSPGGGRRPNADEERIFEIWRQHRLGEMDDVRPGQVIAFLKQLAHLM